MNIINRFSDFNPRGFFLDFLLISIIKRNSIFQHIHNINSLILFF